MLWCGAALANGGLSGSVSATPSLCFDDGTLTVTPTGGSAPYTLTLLSGPANPNITYPVVLASGINTFGGLPSGSYNVLVTDAIGDTSIVTGSVPGTYQFPSLSFSTSGGGTYTATVSGGRAPYQYAISSTGSNTGFGAYQPSNTFSNLCPGFYWIRVIDSCGNIYTNEITYTDSIIAQIHCMNFSKGTLDVTAGGGNAPYTYTIGTVSNNTGNFSGLPAYFSDSLIITDACGVRFAEFIPRPTVSLLEHCPSDGIIYLGGVTYPFTPDTLTFICTNCIPAQTVTRVYTGTPIHADSLFLNQPQSTGYNIVVLSSACGGDTIQHGPPAISNDIRLNIQFLSCKSFQASVSNNGVAVAVDSFVLSNYIYGPTIMANTTGLFEQLPDDFYVVTAYIGSLCNDTPRAFITIPYFSQGCYTLMKDASCHSTWEYSTNILTTETYSILMTPGHFVAGVPGPYYNSNFYGLAPSANYTLVSDSGCSEVLQTPVISPPLITVSAYLPCVGQPVITFTGTDYTYCNGGAASASLIRVRLYYIDSLIHDAYVSTDTSDVVNITGTGRYHYAVYAANPWDTSAALRYDTICPVDSGSIYMDNTQVPYLLSSVALVCDSATAADSVSYQVYGGSIPYTVEIAGFDTITLHGNYGIFPTRQAGTYTMIVYDNCGISRSMTFKIIDTCSGCPYAVISLPDDTLYCAGDTIQLSSSGTLHGQSYEWYINGQLYSQAADTVLISGAGGNNIMLRVISSTGCADTAYAHTSDTCRGCPRMGFVLDSLYCPGDTVQLRNGSIGGIAYRWLINGALYSTAPDTIYITQAVGYNDIMLTVTSVTGCSDTARAHIHTYEMYLVHLDPDTVYCGPFTRVLSTGIASTLWSTGQTGPQITVSAPGTYLASAGNVCGYTGDQITLKERLIPALDLGPDTLLCPGAVMTLRPATSGTYVWQNQSTGTTMTVTQTGTYSVTVTDSGCVASDAISIRYIDAPSAFSLGSDTTICSIFPLRLQAYQPDAYYSWSTGAISPSILADETGTYILVDSNACGKTTDTINVYVESCSCLAIIPTAFSPNGDGVNDKYGALSPCIPTNFVLEVYDRWGQRMFHSEEITEWWDGTYKNVQQPLSVYVYYMKYTDPYTGKSYFQSGNVTLMR